MMCELGKTLVAIALTLILQVSTARADGELYVRLKYEMAPISVFGGEPLTVPMEIYARVGESLKVRGIVVAKSRSFGYPTSQSDVIELPGSKNILREVSLTVKSPAVLSATDHLLLIYVASTANHWELTHTIPVRLYPRAVLQPLAAWSKRNVLYTENLPDSAESWLRKEGVVLSRLDVSSNVPEGSLCVVVKVAEDRPSQQLGSKCLIPVTCAVFTLDISENSPAHVTVVAHHRATLFMGKRSFRDLFNSPPLQHEFLNALWQVVNPSQMSQISDGGIL